MSRLGILLTSTVLALTPLAAIAAPNVITDWDQKGAATVQGDVPAAPRIGPAGATRIMAVMHIAMFEAVNAVDGKYEPYKGQANADPGCSQQAAAATAAAKVLIKMHPESAAKTQQELDAYLAAIPAGEAKDRGIKLGEKTAARVIALRVDDGNDKVYAYRPRTQPGVYVQTMPTVSWEHATMQPFVLTSPSQFRPGPPPDLKGETMGQGLQRDQRPWREEQHHTDGASVRGCQVLALCRSHHVFALPASSRDRQRHVGGRERPLHDRGHNGDDGRRYRNL